jgi:hypothetical protein
LKKIQTQSLTGTVLDWAVGKAVGCAPVGYSTEWEFGGPIIEQESISIQMAYPAEDCKPALWYAAKFATSVKAQPRAHGPTPLVAAMRCFVLSKLGEEVDVPEELLGA